MARILFFSDLHGSAERFELLEKQFQNFRPELLVLLGDVLYHGPRNPLPETYAPPRLVERLNRYRDRIVAVRGNCDCEVDQMLLEFPVMADYSTLLVDGRRFFLTHGHLWTPERPPALPAGTVLAGGHTHLPRLETLPSGLIAFNPGSTTLPKGGNPPSFGLLDGAVLSVRRLDDAAPLQELTLP